MELSDGIDALYPHQVIKDDGKAIAGWSPFENSLSKSVIDHLCNARLLSITIPRLGGYQHFGTIPTHRGTAHSIL